MVTPDYLKLNYKHMEDLLMVRTFSILGGMLVISTIAARLNKTYETFWEKFFTIFGFIGSLILILVYEDIFPHNLIACGIFSAFGGWSLGPTIGYIGERFKWRKFLKDKGVKSKNLNNKSGFWGRKENKHIVYYYEGDEENYFGIKSDTMLKLEDDFKTNVLAFDTDPYNQAWQNVVFQTLIATSLSIFITLLIVYITPTDFGFLEPFLFISLSALVILRLLNYYIFKSDRKRLLYCYAGIVIFTLYLIFDFNRLEQANANGDSSWGTAVDIAIALYLDIINLFLDILQAMAENQ
tara:strand:- start:152 stop:1036 length:885 start_codon:yes stop_codon:yes gene_type:complete